MYKIIILLFLFFFILLAIITFQDLLNYTNESKKEDNKINQLISETIEIQPTANENSGKINWEKLREVNTDIIGWIEIPDTNINYPILHSNNNQYYLTHDFKKEYSRYGSIFTTNTFNDKEIIIYGHNMKNEKMFGELENYKDKSFYNLHRKVNIYTSDKKFEGEVYYFYDNVEQNENNNISQLGFSERLVYYKNKSIYKESNVDNVDKILKLITCCYDSYVQSIIYKRYYIIVFIKNII